MLNKPHFCFQACFQASRPEVAKREPRPNVCALKTSPGGRLRDLRIQDTLRPAVNVAVGVPSPLMPRSFDKT
jgi:hypothetical protein